jgi:hypothetical protein
MLALTLALFFCLHSAIAQEHEEDGKLEHVVATDNISGVSLLLANLYNNERLLYALAVTFMMATLGIIVGQATDFLLKVLGIKRPRKH